MRREAKIMNHQIEQLKEEIAAKARIDEDSQGDIMGAELVVLFRPSRLSSRVTNSIAVACGANACLCLCLYGCVVVTGPGIGAGALRLQGRTYPLQPPPSDLPHMAISCFHS